ncbi:MAG: hypothetical protein GF328_08495, partial [Candidatus Latescibacteria bacterium]|nr:hypothetical protein [Candidatus Latescibacterota bacterium]
MVWSLRIRLLAGAAVAAGIALRAIALLQDRALWVDEACLALNVVGRSFGGFLDRLSWDQVAPVGFLAVEKLLVMLIGPEEIAFRLFPFLC